MSFTALQLPHWLIIAGTALIAIGIIGIASRAMRRER